MNEADWTPYVAPAIIQRDINITGVHDDMYKWPVLDLGFTKAKVQMEPGFILTFTRVVLRRWRRGPHFQAPGLDLIATGREPAERSLSSGWAHVRFHNMAWIHRACLAPSLGRLVTNNLARPEFAPGSHTGILNTPQEGCVSGDDDAPLLRRCWPLALTYTDLITFGYNMRGYEVLPANYVLWLQSSFVRCEVVLNETCVRQWGSPLGCFYVMFPNDNPTSPSASTTTGDGGSSASGGSGGGGGSGENSSRGGAAAATSHLMLPAGLLSPAGSGGEGGASLLGPLLGGLAGGAVASAAVVCLLALIMAWTRRRRRSAAGDAGRHLTEGAEGGGYTAAAAPMEKKASIERWQATDAEAREGAPSRWPPPVRTARAPRDAAAGAVARPGARPAAEECAAALGAAEGRCGGLAEEQEWKGGACLGASASAATAGVSYGNDPALTRLLLSCLQPHAADASSAAPVTPLTPLQPDVNLRLSLGTGEVAMLPGVIGKGTFGRVVPGRYAGQQVAVKLLDYGLLMGPDGGGGGERKAAEAGAPPQHSIIQCLSMEPPTTAAPVATGSAAAAAGGATSTAAAGVRNASDTTLSSFAMRSLAERHFPDQFLRMLVPGRGVGSGITGVAAAATGESAGAPEAAPAATALHPSRGELQKAEALGSLRGVLKRGLEAAKPTGLKEFIARNFGDGRVGGGGGVNDHDGGDGSGGAFIQGSGTGLGRAGCVQSGGCQGADGDEGRQGADGAATAAAAAAVLPAATKPMEAAVNAGALAGDSRQRTFMQEVEVLARIRHPNIVRLLAACTEPPHMCLVMELMETSLDRLLYGAGPGTPLMPLAKVLHIGLQIASALEFLHPTIMHRDLKPANVLLQNAASPTPIVKLADFGLSRLQTSVLVTEHVGVGTIAYMAPETLSAVNRVVTHHVDIYALGVILWELLAGVRPWAGLGLVQIAVAVEMRRERPPLEVLPAERCPPKLRALIQRCWDHVPARRPAAAEVVKELLLVRMQMLVAARGGRGSSSSQATTAAAAAGVGASVTSARCLGRLNAMVDRPGLHPAVGYREASPADLGGP